MKIIGRLKATVKYVPRTVLSWSQALETSVKQDKQKKELEERLWKKQTHTATPKLQTLVYDILQGARKPREKLSLARNTHLYYYYETHLEFLLGVEWVRNKSTRLLLFLFNLLFRFHFQQTGKMPNSGHEWLCV